MGAARFHPADFVDADTEETGDLVLAVLVFLVAQEFPDLFLKRLNLIFPWCIDGEEEPLFRPCLLSTLG